MILLYLHVGITAIMPVNFQGHHVNPINVIINLLALLIPIDGIVLYSLTRHIKHTGAIPAFISLISAHTKSQVFKVQ